MASTIVDNTVSSNNNVSVALSSATENDVGVALMLLNQVAEGLTVPQQSTGTGSAIEFFTRDSFLKDLFKVQSGTSGSSVEELMEKYPYLPLFAIFSLLIAKTTEGSVETIMEVIQAQQKQQKVISQSVIDEVEYTQKKKEELSEDDWKALVGTDVTGAERKEKTKNAWWKIIIGVAVIAAVWVTVAVVSIATEGAAAPAAIGIGAAVTGSLMAVGTVCSLVANVITNPKHKRNLMLAASIINPVQAIAEGAVDAVCEIWGLDPNDEKVRKAKMWLTLALTIIFAVISIAASVFTAGASTAATVASIINIVNGIITGATSIVTGALEIRNGERALDCAEMRKILNQVQASIDRMKMILDMIGTNIELWTEMFSNDMTIIRGEYERATRMLKEYNDQKVAIARNIRA